MDGSCEEERNGEERLGPDKFTLGSGCVANDGLAPPLLSLQEAKGSKDSDREGGGFCCCCGEGWVVLAWVFGRLVPLLSSEMLNSSKFSSSEGMVALGLEKNSSRVMAGLVVALTGCCVAPFPFFILVKGSKVSCFPVLSS